MIQASKAVGLHTFPRRFVAMLMKVCVYALSALGEQRMSGTNQFKTFLTTPDSFPSRWLLKHFLKDRFLLLELVAATQSERTETGCTCRSF
jgi:hypothetical protein